MVFWMIVTSIIGIAILGLIVWLVARKGPWRIGRASAPYSAALETLKERYARGEIDTATFDEMHERLEGTGKTMHEPTPAH